MTQPSQGFPQSFYGKLGVFKSNDNIKLPSINGPVVPTIVSQGSGVGNTTLTYPAPGGGTWVYHTFTSSGTLVVGVGTTAGIAAADILVVAGGGAGSISQAAGLQSPGAGGGGAGGVVYATNVALPADTYTIVIGAGGTADGLYITGQTGGDSYILTGFGTDLIRSLGGGRGGGLGGSPGITSMPQSAGGSGGGGYYDFNSGVGATGLQTTYTQASPTGIITSYGSKGGNMPVQWPAGGSGGGGATGVGGNGGSRVPNYSISAPGGAGGNGINPTPVTLTEFNGSTIGVPALAPLSGYYGGGGGGAGGREWNRAANPGQGGVGGGGNGCAGFVDQRHPNGGIIYTEATPGVKNSGGGGGGGSQGPPGVPQYGSGGSGIVVIRYRATIT